MSSDEARLAKHKDIRSALSYVASHPQLKADPIDSPVWELVARALFEVANNPNPKVRGSLARSTRAQRMISRRLVGLRRPGSHPAVHRNDKISFVDLTAGSIEP